MNKIFLFIILFINTGVYSQTNWTPVSPNFFPTNASGQIHGISRVSQVKFHPTNSSKMYAVSSRGGLFITSNSGTTWTLAPGCDLLPNMRLNSVCIDYTNDQMIYLGTGDANYYYSGSGVYKSTNGGATFTSSGLSGRLIVEILMNPANNQMLIAATDAGIYKSINGGTSWTLKSANTLACRDLVFKAKAGTQTLFASTYSELYRSTDMGETWTQLTSGIYIPSGATTGGGCRVAVTPADSNMVYLHMVAKNGTVFKSTNGGNTFVNVKDSVMPNLIGYDNTSNSTGQGDYNSMFNADPLNANILYYGAHNFWKSTNGGVSWSKLTDWWAVLHTDMHWVKVNPYNTSQIWTANDGGVWVSTNGGSNWTPKSDGIYGYEIYHGACSPTRRDMFSIGTQDNGELYHSSGTWFTNRGGDWGSVCAFDYRSNSSMVYYFSNNERRLVTGGDQTYGLPVASLQDIAFHRGNPSLAFAANQDVYRTVNLTATTPTWTKITNINKTIKAVHVNLADSNKLYIITSDANIYVSTNALSATPTFTNYVLPFSTNNAASITSIKSSSNTLYAVMNTRVYRSTDNGATWTNISSNLPSVNWVKILPDEYFSSNQMVFVAGNNTVYYKQASQSNWTLFSNSLPARTTINDFSLYDNGTNQSVLRVSEYGRGMWEVPMTSLRTVSSEFSANETQPCTGSAVQFNDQSTGNATSWNWTFPGGTPSSSTLQNPVVIYNTAGIYSVSLTVSDGTTNSSLTKSAYINTNGTPVPVSEGFEGSEFLPVGWEMVDDGNNAQVWEKTSSVGGFGNSSSSCWFNNYSINANGLKDAIHTSKIDLNSRKSALLTFDVAYQPYNTTNYSDTFQVLVSTNCGTSFTSLYLKGGGTLSTVSGTNTSPFVPTNTQWRTETISLNAYVGNNIILAFRNIGRYGNNLYIDNILIDGMSVNAGSDDTICKGSSKTIGMTPESGVAYSWSPTTGLSSATISNPVATLTANTTYVLAATKAGTPMTSSDTIALVVDSVHFNGVVSVVNCFGGNDGAIDVTVSYGISPYSYQWNNGATTQDRTGLTSGTHTLTVTDVKGCIKTRAFLVLQPSALNASVSNSGTTCGLNNGTATVTISGGSSPYSRLWNNGSTAASINNLSPGSYSVVATDNRGCTKTAMATIVASSAALATASSNTPVCENDTIKLYAGSASTYTWTGPNTFNSTQQNPIIVNAGNNNAGNYTVSITNANGCTGSVNTSVVVNTCILSLNVKAYIEGIYLTSGNLNPVFYNSSMDTSTTVADSITVQLRNQFSPNTIIHSVTTIIKTDGTISLSLPGSFNGNSYYITLLHRNSLETWSKIPVTLGTNTTYDFRY